MAKAGPGAPPGGRWVMGVRAATQGRPYGDYRKGQQIRESGWGRSPAPYTMVEKVRGNQRSCSLRQSGGGAGRSPPYGGGIAAGSGETVFLGGLLALGAEVAGLAGFHGVPVGVNIHIGGA